MRQIAMRLTAFFIWLPIMLVVLARALNILQTPETLFSPWVGVAGVLAAYIVSAVYVPDGPRAPAIKTAALIASFAMALALTVTIRVPGGFFDIASREQNALFGVALGGGFAMGFAFSLFFVNANPVRPIAAAFLMLIALIGQANVSLLLTTSLGVGVIMALSVYPIRQDEPQRLQNQNMPLRIMYALLLIFSNLALIRLIYLG